MRISRPFILFRLFLFLSTVKRALFKNIASIYNIYLLFKIRPR